MKKLSFLQERTEALSPFHPPSHVKRSAYQQGFSGANGLWYLLLNHVRLAGVGTEVWL